jgi:hypothetical protein
MDYVASMGSIVDVWVYIRQNPLNAYQELRRIPEKVAEGLFVRVQRVVKGRDE